MRLESDMTSLLRKGKEERLEGIGSSRGMDWMLISVTKGSEEEHVMEVQLHGLVSRMFQLEKIDGGGDAELWSHEKRVEASWLAEKARPQRRVA